MPGMRSFPACSACRLRPPPEHVAAVVERGAVLERLPLAVEVSTAAPRRLSLGQAPVMAARSQLALEHVTALEHPTPEPLDVAQLPAPGHAAVPQRVADEVEQQRLPRS